MERKVTIKTPEKATKKKEPKYNDNGKRIIENWCLYAERLMKKERLKAKKEPVVSKITEKDRQIFKDAYRKLRQQQASSDVTRRQAIKRLVRTRSKTQSAKSERCRTKPPDDNYVYCKIDYNPKSSKSHATKKSKSQMSITSKRKPVVAIPPFKTKKWSPPGPPKRKPRPVVVIPPVKTRPWVPPCQQPPKPIVKPIIDYPPLKMRKVQSTPKLSKSKQKTLTITIPPVRVKPKKSCNQIQDQEFCNSLKRVNKLINQLELVQIDTPKEFGDHHQKSKAEGEKLYNYPEFNLFTSTNDVRSIRGTEVKTIEMTQENVPMEICYAVATLCISRSLDPEFYTRDIIDKIIVFGNDLVTQCSQVCIADFDLCQQSVCPEEINWNFELNNVFTNIQMDIFQRGVVTTHPGPPPHLMHSLDEFFTFYTVGILVTNSFVVAIWRDNGEYFIFYSHPIDEVGKISTANETSSTQTVFPGLVVFKSVGDLYNNILGNIPASAYCKPFELRICSITMTDLCDIQETDPCVRHTKSLLDVEWVLPAVAMPDDVDSFLDKMNSAKKVKQPNFSELMRKIKKKSCTEPGFIKFANGGFICGQISKRSKVLDLHHITKEFHANAIGLASVAMSSLKELNCWCGEIIDCVIRSGNNLYIESVIVNNTMDIPLKKLIKSLIFDDTQVDMTIEPIRDDLKGNLELDFLLATFDELFCCYSNIILSRGKECWTLFKRCKGFFLFDPLGFEVKGKKMCRRRAVLYKFESLDLVMEQLMNILEDTLEDDCDDTCKISAIFSCPTRLQQEKKIRPPCPKKKPAKTCHGDFKTQEMMMLKDIEPICEKEEEKTSNCDVIDDICEDLCEN